MCSVECPFCGRRFVAKNEEYRDEEIVKLKCTNCNCDIEAQVEVSFNVKPLYTKDMIAGMINKFVKNNK